ncbi:MAG TPA: HAMP domain-containing histidine kinase, partial [Desulfobacterales bacterium]|nr:HAMP domain-containing histidine kinase [Desulfobacterales bacterium]
YARVVTTKEEVDANQVINDALQILEEALRNRSVEVERRFGDLPPVAMEQARLLQIFINLIKNAYEAMEAPEIAEKRLTITTTVEEEGKRVVVSVKDTGVGFEPQMAERLFRFGFTTKASGSGFGLHSCANYLLANDGTITARSDGPGQGAEFVVSLPAARPAEDE